MRLSPGVEYATRVAKHCELLGEAAHRVRVDLLFDGVPRS